MYFLTYNALKNNDGVGGQIQRIISLYLLTKHYNLNYFHSDIVLDKNTNYYSLKDVIDEFCLEEFNKLFVELKNNIDIEFKKEICIQHFDNNVLDLIANNPTDYNVLIKICCCHTFIDNNVNIVEKFIPPTLSWIDSKINNLE